LKKLLFLVTFFVLISANLFFTHQVFSDTDLPPDATYASGSNAPAHFTVTATPTTTLTVNDGGNISATGNVSIDTVTWGNGTVTFEGNSNVAGSIGTSGLNVGTVNINGASGKIVDLQYTGGASAIFSTLNFGSNGTTILRGGSYINSINNASATAGYGTVEVASTGNLNVYVGVGSAALPINAITIDTGTAHFIGAINVYANSLTVTNDGYFVFDDGANFTGTGITTTDGTGILELDGSSTITGTVGAAGAYLTRVSAGADTETDAFTGDIYADNINFLGDGVITFANGVDYNAGTGTGITTSTSGEGTLTFLGASSTAGSIGQSGTPIAAVNINGGTVVLNNNIYATNTTVNSGGRLQLGANEIVGGALTLAGTGSMDLADYTLTNSGTYVQGASTTLILTANSTSDFGKINTTGNASVTAGSTVNVSVGGYIPNNATFTIIDGAAGSTYGALTVGSTSSRVTFSSSSQNGDLILTASRSGTGYASLAANSNANAAGATLDSISSPSSSMQSVLNTIDGMSDAQITSGLNSLTPTVDNSALQVSYETQDQSIQTIASRLDDINSSASGVSSGDERSGKLSLEGLDIWSQGFGSYLHEDPRGLSNGYNATIWGIIVGADYPVTDNLRLGAAGGFAQDFVNSKDNSATDDIDSYSGSVYGLYSKGPYYLDFAASFAYNTYDTSRQVAIGSLGYTSTADFNGQGYSIYTEGGYIFKIQKFELTPLVSFQYMHLHISDYTEDGAGVLSIKADSQDYDVAQTGLGCKLGYPLAIRYGTLIPEIRVKWLYDWVGDDQQVTSNFTGGGGAFDTTGFTPAQSSYDFGTKLTLITKYNVSFAVNYDCEVKEDFYAHYGYLNVRYSF